MGPGRWEDPSLETLPGNEAVQKGATAADVASLIAWGNRRDGTAMIDGSGPVTIPAYSASATIYDAMVGLFAFEHWRENFERLEKRYGFDISCVADVACGSGLAAAYLARRGARVFACDLSLHMLREAAAKCSGSRVVFIKQDMRYLQLPGAASLINCATDAINHLLSEEDIRRALSSFHAALRPGGYAAFDMNTAWQLREGSDADTWEVEADGRRMR
jgi:SAM-dependent methyltransferase